MSTILFFLAGAFLGWNLPQPQFLKDVQTKVVTFFKSTPKV